MASYPMLQFTKWEWSAAHRDYYCFGRYPNGEYVRDASGQDVYYWASQHQQLSQPQLTQTVANVVSPPNPIGATPADPRRDSVVQVPDMAPAAPADVGDSLHLRGTPGTGWYETLDNSYCVRTSREAHQFFVTGRVFAMLWAEPAGETIQARNPTENSQVTVHPNPAITTGRYGQPIYSQIRRFVIVKVNRKQYFVYACPITTYGNRGVLKPGCNASEHVMVYRNGTRPELIPGERERGMTKDPIAINIEDAQEEMHPASRLRLGKITSIEWNVKVRNIGMVIPEHRSRLMAYYRAEQNNGFDNDNDDDTNYQGPQYPGPYATQNTYQY